MNTPDKNDQLLRALILDIEAYCKKNKLNHRFVGGVSYGGLLNKKTTLTVSSDQREIHLHNHNPLTFFRSDKTLRDIDFIFLEGKRAKIIGLKRYVARLKREVRHKIGRTPSVSFEGLLPHSVAPPKGFLKFVTVLEKHHNRISLRFETIRQPISMTSLEPWTVILEDGMRFTTRSPIADYYAYQFRSPSGVKPKDVEKLVYLKKAVSVMLREAGRGEYYRPWATYTKRLATSTNPRVTSKRFITSWYWNTIGTNLAHGKGIFRKSILAFFNLVTRIRQ